MPVASPAHPSRTHETSGYSMDATEACFVYTPPSFLNASTGNGPGQRPPKKRRKIAPSTGASEGHVTLKDGNRQQALFAPLLHGKESAENVTLRAEAYEALWSAKERALETVLEDANAATVQRIVQFVSETEPAKLSDSQIPTGFVTAGLATSSSGSIFGAVALEARKLDGCIVIPVSAGECQNLKAALKTVIRNGTADGNADYDEEAEDDGLGSSRKGVKRLRLLNYDLQALHEYLGRRSITRCVLFFQSSEALDGNVLSELVDVLSCWQDRIPFVILMEIAVSVDLFQEKLSRSTIRRLRGTTFESKTASEILDVLFRAATSAGEGNSLWLGPAASKLLLDRQTEHIQSAKGFISALKYMYMTHFYTSSLTILLSEMERPPLQREHFDAIRRLPSFKRYIQDLTEDRQSDEAQSLLQDNAALEAAIPTIISQSRKALQGLSDALEVLSRIHDCAPTKGGLTWSALYIKALAGELADSPLLRELSLSVRKLSSDKMSSLLSSLASIETLDLGSAVSDLAALSDKSKTASSSASKPGASRSSASARTPGPLHSEYDTHHSTVRTTVISQKVALTRHKAALSPLDAAYSKFVTRIDLLLKNFFSANLPSASSVSTSSSPSITLSIPLAEILIFDSGKSAVSNALGGAPRAAVERALGRPADYLACECCDVEEGRLVGTKPVTCLVWQLVGEGGVLVNVEDLWRAFRAVVEVDDGEEGGGGMERDVEALDGEVEMEVEAVEEEGGAKEVELLSLFYRALAELKYLGIIKPSRKKVDHLMKVRWKGL